MSKSAPTAWMDPETRDVINAERKQEWLTHYGDGGKKKAIGYTVPLFFDATEDAGDLSWEHRQKHITVPQPTKVGQLHIFMVDGRREASTIFNEIGRDLHLGDHDLYVTSGVKGKTE